MSANWQASQKTTRRKRNSLSLRHRELFRSGEFLPGKLGLCLRSGLDRFGIFGGFTARLRPFAKLFCVKYWHLRVSFFPKVRNNFKAYVGVKRAKGDTEGAPFACNQQRASRFVRSNKPMQCDNELNEAGLYEPKI